MNRSAPLGRVLSIGTIAALLLTSAADAATIANHDDKATKLTVIEGPAREDRVLDPGKEIAGICRKGCIIRLNGKVNDEYELDGSERVSIEDGFLYYDGSATEGAPATSGSTTTGGARP